MKLTKEMEERVINGWLEANNGVLYQQVDGRQLYIADLPDDTIHYISWERLYDDAVYNTLMAVQSLRAQGESDKDIRGYGYVLPETIDTWNKAEDVQYIERALLDSGGYIYRGKLEDGRYFFGGMPDEPAEIVTDGVLQYDPEVLAEDPFDIHTGEQTRVTLGDLWRLTKMTSVGGERARTLTLGGWY